MDLLDVRRAAVQRDSEVSDCASALGRQRPSALKCFRPRYVRVGDLEEIVRVAGHEEGNHADRSEARRRQPPIAQ